MKNACVSSIPLVYPEMMTISLVLLSDLPSLSHHREGLYSWQIDQLPLHQLEVEEKTEVEDSLGRGGSVESGVLAGAHHLNISSEHQPTL